MVIQDLVQGAAVRFPEAVVADGAVDVEFRQGVALGREGVEFELLDGGLDDGEVGAVVAREFVRKVKRDLGVARQGREIHRADLAAEVALAEALHQHVLVVVDDMLVENELAAGRGHTDLGLQHVEVGEDTGLPFDAIFFIEFLGEAQAVLLDFVLFAREDQVVVSGFHIENDGEHRALEIQVGDLHTELGALDGGKVVINAGSLQEGLRQGERDVAGVGGI